MSRASNYYDTKPVFLKDIPLSYFYGDKIVVFSGLKGSGKSTLLRKRYRNRQRVQRKGHPVPQD